MKYAKGWASLAITVLTLVVGVMTDGITAAEWLTVGGAAVGTVAVVGLPNLPENPAVKTVAQVAGVILGGLAAAIVTPDGITTSVVVQLVIAAAGAIGVYEVKNVGDKYAVLRARHAA